MRVILVLLMFVGLANFAAAQKEKRQEIPIQDFFLTVYENSDSLKLEVNKVMPILKKSPDSKIYIIYYKSSTAARINFNKFKLLALKFLVKSNSIESKRISVVDGGYQEEAHNSFQILIFDKNENRIYP